MPPQDVGVINGLAEYPEENLRQPNSQSVIHLRMATVEMSGEYTCTISTFQGEDSKRSRMIVYGISGISDTNVEMFRKILKKALNPGFSLAAPEKDATIHVSSFNETHLNLTCVVNGAYPRPILKFYVEGAEVHSYYDRTEKTEWYRKDLSVKRVVIVRNTFEPTLLDCEVSIPRTDYKRRERIIYYPGSSIFKNPNVNYWVASGLESLCKFKCLRMSLEQKVN